MTTPSEAICEAWRHRYLRNIETCVTLLSEIKASALAESQLDILLLQSSLARATGQTAASNLHFENAKCLTNGDGTESRPFFFLMESAIREFIQGEYLTSLDLFLQAATIATHLPKDYVEEFRLHAKFNAYLCMDNLGLPSPELSQELKLLLNESAPAGLKAHFDASEQRLAFRAGAFDSFPQHLSNGNKAGSGQHLYFPAWISSLPYIQLTDSIKLALNSEKNAFIQGAAGGYQRSYRLHTLQGILHPQDLTRAHPSELADRIYLWTWRWMTEGNDFPLQRVLSLFESSSFFSLSHRFTLEDKLLLKNALQWLILFDSEHADLNEHPLKARLDLLGPTQFEFAPILELENILIHYLLALKAHKLDLAADYKKSLLTHPLIHSPTLQFHQISIFDKSTPELRFLTQALVTLCQNQHATPEDASLVIDVSKHQVKLIKNGRPASSITSESLVLAYSLLQRTPIVSQEEFCRVVFGITHFDPLIHMSKIYNLINRMKELSPTPARFQVKAGKLICQLHWEKVCILRPDTLSGELSTHPVWKNLKQGPSPSVEKSPSQRTAKQPLLVHKEITRKDLELLLNRPRSTVNRLLVRWEKMGWIKKQHQGPATRYRIHANFDALTKEIL